MAEIPEENFPIPHPLGARIARGATAAFGVNVLAYGFLFAGQILIARLLSQMEYAEFTVSISFVAILALVADLGMNSLFTRLFAEAEEDVANGGEDRRGLLLGSALTLRVALSVLVAVFFFVVAPMLYPAGMVDTMSILLLTLLISSRMLIVRSVGEAVLRGRGKYYIAAWFALFDSIAFAVLMLLATSGHAHLEQVVWIYTLANVPGFFMLAQSIGRWLRREHIRLRVTLRAMRELLHASLPLAFGTAFLTIHTQIDNLLLNKLSTPMEVASYGATLRLSAAMAPFSLVMAAVTGPELTRLVRRADHGRSRQLTSISLRLLLVIGAAIAIVVTTMSGIIVPLVLGAKYSAASSLLIWAGWILIPVFVITLLMELSIATGHSWFMTTTTGVAMATLIIGDLILIPTYGSTGAMASRLASVAVGAGVILWLSRNSTYLDVRRFTFGILRTGLSVCLALLSFAALRAANLNIFLSAPLVVGIYFFTIHFTRVLPLSEAVSLLKRIRNSSKIAT